MIRCELGLLRGRVARAARDAGRLWSTSPCQSLDAGIPDLRVASCCREHAGQYSASCPDQGSPGSPLVIPSGQA